MPRALRHLVLVLGDQLNLDAAAFDDFDPAMDAVWMAEVGHEATQVWSTKPRIERPLEKTAPGTAFATSSPSRFSPASSILGSSFICMM